MDESGQVRFCMQNGSVGWKWPNSILLYLIHLLVESGQLDFSQMQIFKKHLLVESGQVPFWQADLQKAHAGW